MLNKSLNLSHKLFSSDMDERAIRDGYGEGLLEAGKNKDVVVLVADLKDSTRTNAFERVYPERFFEMGITEQNMAGVASGLGISDKIPFINSYATFSPGRNWEQIRTTIAYNDSNVKIAGHHAGLITGADGATHQAIEDIATMRVIPNMNVVVPCDYYQARKATVAISKIWGPVYIRLARERTPVITTKETPFVFGKAQTFWKSKKKSLDAVIIASGAMVYNSMVAAKELEKDKISVDVVNLHTIKPLDDKAIIKYAKKAGAIIVVEEHNVIGGVGSAVAELVSKKYPVPMEFVGIQDLFGQSGKPSELFKKYHLDVKDIISATKKVVKRK